MEGETRSYDSNHRNLIPPMLTQVQELPPKANDRALQGGHSIHCRFKASNPSVQSHAHGCDLVEHLSRH
eukprot:9654344-Karenia_brevis.AAC.1